MIGKNDIDWAELGGVDEIIDRALAEDLATGDVTSRCTVSRDHRARARIVARQQLSWCGGPVARRIVHKVDSAVRITWHVAEGDTVAAGTEVMSFEGPARSILAAERTMLNILQRMCGVASLTRTYVDAAGGRCRITDTRKTMPGLRALDRYAVRCGGGHNHRNDLGAGVLIKENHVRCTGGVAAAVEAAKATAPHPLRIQCEVSNLDELRAALDAGADAALLDNMSDDEVARAVHVAAGRIMLEVSGGITLDRISTLAELGVDCISIGALTHSANAADLSLLLDEIGTRDG